MAFVAGSVLATFHVSFWSMMPSLGDVALGERLGWGPAAALQLAALGLLAVAVRRVEAWRGPIATPSRASRGWERWVRHRRVAGRQRHAVFREVVVGAGLCHDRPSR